MTAQPEQTDEAAAASVQQGNTQAFGVLVERYEAKLLRYARRFLLDPEDSLDVVQEVFIKAYQNIMAFDRGRAFSPWIYRIAHNEFINHIRKKGREPVSFFDPDLIFPHPVSKSRADDDVNRQELSDTIEKFLGKLDAKYREPLVLYYYEDMAYQQISEVLHIPVSTVGVRITRAKAALQKLYKESTVKI